MSVAPRCESASAHRFHIGVGLKVSGSEPQQVGAVGETAKTGIARPAQNASDAPSAGPRVGRTAPVVMVDVQGSVELPAATDGAPSALGGEHVLILFNRDPEDGHEPHVSRAPLAVCVEAVWPRPIHAEFVDLVPLLAASTLLAPVGIANSWVDLPADWSDLAASGLLGIVTATESCSLSQFIARAGSAWTLGPDGAGLALGLDIGVAISLPSLPMRLASLFRGFILKPV